MSPQNNHLQRPPAAVLYADELAKLKQNDNAPCPPGWQLSLPAARAFILGDEAQNISRKVVISPSAVERMLVTLATGRGLMLVGEPGTAKSLLSELLATAISGDAGLTIQGGASTTEDQIKYGWNYALLINHGPSTEALVPAPLYQGMRDGKIVRFEEITRTPLEVQDCLLGMLSDRVMTVPELTGEASQLYAREGFNIIATANTRNRLSSVVPLSPDAWQMLSAPLRQPGIVALREYLRQRPPACIRPLNQVDNLFILPVAECISLGWDSSRQTLDAQVISGEGEDNLLTLSLPASASAPYAVERMAALLQQTEDPVCLVSGFVSFVEGQLTLEPQVMMTKTRAWALDAETAPVAPLPSASVLPVPSTAHQLLIRCQALLIQLLHNGWRYQEQSAIGQAELLANDLTAVGFYRLAHVLGQFRNTESEARVEAMNNVVLLCEQLFPMLQQQG